MGTTLDFDGRSTEVPTDEDIAAALAAPRDTDFFLALYRGEEDYMDVMVEDEGLWVECEEDGKFLCARSFVDDEAVRAMLVAFRDGKPGWRDLAAWGDPAKPAARGVPPFVPKIAAAAAVTVVAFVAAALVTGNNGWLALLLVLAFPGVIAIVALVKREEARRAAGWTKTQARILRSGMAKELRYDKEVTVPRVEYEYAVGFHKFRGRKVSLAELVVGPDAKAMLARFPVGASVPAYYDPADPNRAVLERELPPFFRTLWIALAVMTALILGIGGWLLLR